MSELAKDDPGPLRSLADRLRFEEFLSALSSAFVSVEPAHVDAEIERWLQRLSELLDVDRASVAQMSPDGRALHITHSYAVEGVPPMPKIVMDHQFPWYVAQVRQGRILARERLADGMPTEALGELAHMETAGLKSHAMVPFTVGGTTLGALGVGVFRAHRTWPEPVVKQLQLIAEVIGNALARRRTWQALEERLAFERLIADLVKSLVSVDGDELDAAIEAILRRLVGYFGVDRASFGRFAADGTVLVTHQARVDEGVPSLPSRPHLPNYYGALRSGRVVHLSRIPDDIPAEWTAERDALIREQVLSMLGIPLTVGGRVQGGIGFAALRAPRRWTDEEVQRLGLVGEIFMEALLRREAEEAGRRQRGELTHMARVGALGQLTAAIAHELNQPLAAIRANAQATRRLLAAGRHPDDLDEVLGDIVNDAGRAGDLIRRLRDLLRRRELEKVPLDVNQTLRDVEAIALAEARRHEARLVLQLAPSLPRVAGDAVQLQQVLLNLVRNASEAMGGTPPDDREIVVRTSAETPEELTVCVEDAGPPVDEATLEAMFTPFHTTKPEGLGMGLAISRSIVEAHGGRLWASRRPERGLVIWFTLPVRPGPPA